MSIQVEQESERKSKQFARASAQPRPNESIKKIGKKYHKMVRSSRVLSQRQLTCGSNPRVHHKARPIVIPLLRERVLVLQEHKEFEDKVRGPPQENLLNNYLVTHIVQVSTVKTNRKRCLLLRVWYAWIWRNPIRSRASQLDPEPH